MVRGDFRRRGPELEAGFVRAADVGGVNVRAKTRDGLAEWLTDAANPLVARVVVNRVWQGHFGRGLVGSPDDFGVLGERPTHPALLDHLAGELVRRGWSLKAMHRLLVTSAAYRQASFVGGDAGARARAADPGNRLLWRMNRRRLSGEEVRDAMLAAGGLLNPKRGGPGVRPPLPREVTVTLLRNQWPVTEGKAEHARRSIYLFARRNLKYPMFDVFDRPEGNAPCGRRHESTTATQALTQLNSAFSWEMAEALAARVRGEQEPVEAAFERVVGRKPDREEVALGRGLVDEVSLEAYCLGLFNLNAFLYVE